MAGYHLGNLMYSVIKKNQWKKTVLLVDSSIFDAIKSLNESTLKIVLISNKEKKLIGTITDGDIRRFLLKNKSLNTSVDKIMQKKPFYIFENMNDEYIYTILRKKKISSLPILDSKMNIKGLIALGEYNYVIKNKHKNIKKFSNPFVIMAGGMGKRMRPLTNKVPKPMLILNGKPLLEHIIVKARDEGFINFYISVNYLSNQILKYFLDGKHLSVNIKYIEEKKYLGTAGSLSYLKKIKEKINHPFIVCNADIYSDINFSEILKFHKKRKADATMGMRVYENSNLYGVIETRGYQIKNIIEKPTSYHKVNAGIYVIEPKLLSLLKEDKIKSMIDFFLEIPKKIVYPIYESWLDIGHKEDYLKVKNDKKKK